ncbi:MAG: hypothetical protein RLZZ340_109 [Actinomycetota bacterium]
MSKRATGKDIIWGVAWVLLAILSYEVLNHSGRHRLIDISTDFDRAMPLVPAFVITYLSFIPLVFIFVPVLALRSGLVFRAYTLSIFVAQMILNVLYLLVPATVVRPTIETNDIFSILLRDLVWQLDEPLNTFPSNHVTLSVIAIFALASLKLGRWWVLPLQLWLGVVCISTLLVYQHVVLDLIAGVVIGAAVYLLTQKLVAQRESR